MEFRTKVDGTRIYPKDFKKQILAELTKGVSPAELARSYQIPMQNIIKWKRLSEQTGNKSYGGSKIEEGVPLSEYQKLVDENKCLKRSLANMTMDRDILKDAVDIAAKKKWI